MIEKAVAECAVNWERSDGWVRAFSKGLVAAANGDEQVARNVCKVLAVLLEYRGQDEGSWTINNIADTVAEGSEGWTEAMEFVKFEF